MIIKLSLDKISVGRVDMLCEEYLNLNGIMEITIDGMTLLKLNFEDEEIKKTENFNKFYIKEDEK